MNLFRRAGLTFALLVAALGATALIWLPWAEDSAAILARVFPYERGLYEDRVANFWCFLSNLINVRKRFDYGPLVFASAIMTCAGVAPTLTLLYRSPNRKSLIVSAFNSAMAFFLFSYMVHEKSILLPLLPFAILFPLFRRFYTSTMLFGLFSNFYLLRKDECEAAYFSVMILVATVGYSYEDSWEQLCAHDYRVSRMMSLAGRFLADVHEIRATLNKLAIGFMLVFHILESCVPPNRTWTKFFVRVNATVSFGWFVFVWLYSHALLYTHAERTDWRDESLLE